MQAVGLPRFNDVNKGYKITKTTFPHYSVSFLSHGKDIINNTVSDVNNDMQVTIRLQSLIN